LLPEIWATEPKALSCIALGPSKETICNYALGAKLKQLDVLCNEFYFIGSTNIKTRPLTLAEASSIRFCRV